MSTSTKSGFPSDGGGGGARFLAAFGALAGAGGGGARDMFPASISRKMRSASAA